MPKFFKSSVRNRLLGQSLVEFIIIFPVLIFLVLGIIQWGLIYQAKSTLNHATLLAARAGAVNNGNKIEMRKGLAAGLTPLFAAKDSLDGYALALGKASLESLPRPIGYASLNIVNPKTGAFNDFQRNRLDGKSGKELPNDTLNYRNTTSGANSGISIQDANILHLRTTYCYRLIVPIVGRVINKAANALPFSSVLGSTGMSDPFGLNGSGGFDPCTSFTDNTPRMQIQSEAIVRMQSPFFRDNL